MSPQHSANGEPCARWRLPGCACSLPILPGLALAVSGPEALLLLRVCTGERVPEAPRSVCGQALWLPSVETEQRPRPAEPAEHQRTQSPAQSPHPAGPQGWLPPAGLAVGPCAPCGRGLPGNASLPQATQSCWWKHLPLPPSWHPLLLISWQTLPAGLCHLHAALVTVFALHSPSQPDLGWLP